MATCVVLCAFHRAKPSDPLATFWDKVGLGITGLSNKSFCKEWVAPQNVEFLHLIYTNRRIYSIRYIWYKGFMYYNFLKKYLMMYKHI